MIKTWDEMDWHSKFHYYGDSENAAGATEIHIREEGRAFPFTPKLEDWYRAYDLTPLDKVKVVILGQDPYPTAGHACGLAFGVTKETSPLPASLRNIFKELTDDIGCPFPQHGDLSSWATQGVLLLNTSLTTVVGQPNAHKGMWDGLINETLRAVSAKEGVVFLLWGRQAQSFMPVILPSGKDRRNTVINGVHPSPLSAHRGFFGSRPFSTVNSYLREPIDWEIR